MTAAFDTVLSRAIASYAKDHSAPAVVTISTQKLVKVERPKKAQPAKAPKASVAIEAAPKPAAPSPNGKVPVLTLPAPGTLGAKAFLMMMRSAKTRDEKICAISGYVGYDGRADFAQQEMAATAKAKGEIRPVSTEGPTREERRQAANSVKGYVSGMPDNQRKIVQDLLGRENLAVDTRNALIRDAETDKSLTPEEREIKLALARLEEERLVQIRADLAQYV